MTTVNQAIRLENAVPPKEITAFRGAYPHILDALIANQTLINQLIIRTGGSGSGSNVVDLSAITARIEENEGQIAAVRALSRAESGIDDAIAEVMSRMARRSQQEQGDADHLMTMIARISAAQNQIMKRIEELEALCLSSLAR